MGRQRGLLIVALLAVLLAGWGTPLASGGEEAPRMTKEQLKALLGSPDLIVIDVRLEGKSAPKKIPGAVFEDPGKADAWSANYPKGKKIVLYCS
jgi:hypothetical protein